METDLKRTEDKELHTEAGALQNILDMVRRQAKMATRRTATTVY